MIRFEHVRKEYPGGAEAVQDFSLEAPTGSITVLVGSSGCGKTTLVRMVNRMVDPSSGNVFIDDTDVASLDPVELRRSIGYVMQSGGLLPHKTVSENIQTVQKLRGVKVAVRLARVEELMATVGLDSELLGRYPAQLSGGQQQRVGVARALAIDPNILLMDEPFGAVDPLVRSDLQQELLAVQKKLAKTVLFVTHDTGGVIVQQGRPADILAAPANDFVEAFIGADRGKRALHIENRGGHRIVVDSDQRVAGRLVEGP
jgi:osmoprotectant transport system ATP-binding protein